MSEAEYKKHIRLVFGKIATPISANRISFFETKTTKGILRYGSGKYCSNAINLLIWDRKRKLFHDINVTVQDAELRYRVANGIAASYQFSIDVVPEHERMLDLAERAAELFNPNAG
ncbi:MAG: hypothetical protein ABJZ55_07635 [Fuerstiella sp.]